MNTKIIGKSLIISVAILTLLWMIYGVFTQNFGIDAGKEIQHLTGRITIRFLLFTVSLSFLSLLFHSPFFNTLKRTAGLTTFFWAFLHLLSYIFLELGGDILLFFSEVFSKTYLIFGVLAFIILLLLAITSNNYSIKKLKKNWKRIHNLVYIAAIFAALHYFISLKAKMIFPIIYLILFVLGLLLNRYRFYKKYHKLL